MGQPCPGLVNNAYNFWSFQWDGANARYYLNGTNIVTRVSNTNVFVGMTDEFRIGDTSLYGTNFSTVSRFDRLIVSNTLRNGISTQKQQGRVEYTTDINYTGEVDYR